MKMVSIRNYRFFFALLFLQHFLFSVCAYAEGNLIDQIDTRVEDSKGIIEIFFNTPVNYLHHTPSSSGKMLEIRIQTLSVGMAGLTENQTLTHKPDDDIPLEEIQFDNTSPQGATLLLRFSRTVQFTVDRSGDNRSLKIILPLNEKKSTVNEETHITPTVVPSEAVKRKHYPYTINLTSSRTPLGLPSRDTHALFEKYYLYKTSIKLKGQQWYRVRLGFFGTLDEAKSRLEELKSLYPEAWIDRTYDNDLERIRLWAINDPDAYRMNLSNQPINPMSLEPAKVAKTPIPAVPAKTETPAVPVQPVTPALPVTAAIPETSAGNDLAELMNQGKLALTKGDYRSAIRIFTKLLNYPNHEYSREALELLGLSRERNQQIAHAIAEYRKYLRLYPEGEGTERVQQRLNALLTARTKAKPTLRKSTRTAKKPVWQTYGSIFQFYRRDVDTTDPESNVTTNSSLDTDLNVTARRRDEKYDIRTQFAGSYRHDLKDSEESEFRVSSLYLDATDRKKTFSARLGRQSLSTGGVLGRFDGIALGYQLNPDWRLNTTMGYPVVLATSNALQTDKYFYGVSADRTGLFENTDVSFFAINQVVDGITDRTAIGAELRYLKPGKTLFTLLDYDVSYNSVNTFLVIGSLRLPDSSTINITGDYRNSPILTTSNALQGQTVLSIDELRQTFSEDEIRQLAQDRTAEFGSATISWAKPLKKDLLFNGDISVSNLGSTPASGGVDAVEGTGYEYFYSAQFVFSNLFKRGDSSILGVRYADASTANTTSFLLNTRYPFNKDWRINPKFRVDIRQRTDDTDIITLRPAIRLDYRARRNVKFEMEAGYEWSDISELTGDRTESNLFFSLGYIADF